MVPAVFGEYVNCLLSASMFLLLFERKLYRTHLCINGEHIRGRIMTVCVGSARGYGLTPSAVPYNGWLDVSVIYRPELIQLFSGMWMLLQGRILNHKTGETLSYTESKSTTCAECFCQFGRAYFRPPFSFGNYDPAGSYNFDYP